MELTSGQKDATRCVVKLVDQCGRPLPFLNGLVKLDISGSARIQGPSEIFLNAGSTGFWVESNGTPGKIVVKASCMNLKSREIIINVV
jgi:beta-galactosidase